MNTWNELRSLLRGRVLTDGEEGFDLARRPWSLSVDQPVAAVVEAADADDVAALVRHAHREGLAVAAQPTGHGASGDVKGAVLLRTGALDEVSVDAERRVARVGAGVPWGRVQEAAAVHGLTGLPGSSPVVGVAGYTLGGGLSWFGRRHGWAADGVTALEVVDARGERARVTAESDPDLFWALRGGGGDFAVVTALEFALHPAPRLYGGRVVWPADRAERVLAAYTEVTAHARRELTVWLNLHHVPGREPTVSVDTTFLGGSERARELLRPLEAAGRPLRDTRAVLPLSELGSVTAEPTDPSPGLSRAALLTDLGPQAVGALLAEPIAPLVGVQVRHLGGAFADASDTPFGPMDERYYLYALGVPFAPGMAPGIRARLEGLVASLGPGVSGRKPLTSLVPGESVTDVFSAQALERLRRIKAERDPRGVVRSNYPVLG
ncbi:FAD-binding oxidoreductase [Nocardiopsis alborubida]|uniref:FAD-binding oxidoreductase n=1 Tax=Nocardiopsis alborubida TaxID=146802 RepID=A0A7X6RPK8_9ACTN|nr:FAD-binding oxidoreductase [Nocardiopsis alborubida]NKY97809.1 FAD-binding oxidoreductase [Nocardiopsis alborubida]